MKQTRQQALLAAALGLLLTASTAWAQQPATMRLRGTIEAVDGNTLTLKSRDGDVKLTLADNALIIAVIKAALTEIREGTFLGSAAIPQADGSALVRFERAQTAITPGQSCVLYAGDRVLGGAPIARALPKV